MEFTAHASALGPGFQRSPPSRGARWVVRELFTRQRTLALFGALLLAALLPAAIAYGLDERTLRGANVWLKPMKFALSIGVLSLTTAWFIGHLRADRRRGPWVRAIVWMVIGAGSFELAYITLQAGRGIGSHYNVADPVHSVMYTLMGVGAIVLTASQPLLAWQLWRHHDASIPPVYRWAVMAGLVLTFVLGAGAGFVLGGHEPPSAVHGVAFLGWAPSAGDLRPAHFLGIHAEHFLPAAGLALAVLNVRWARGWLVLLTVLYVAGFGTLLLQAMSAVAP
jgi:hypothetical protein